MIALFFLSLVMIPVTMLTKELMDRTDRKIAEDLDNRLNGL